MLKIRYKTKFLAIAVLIGGKSNRFGSDKGLFEFLGKPLVSYQLETLSQLNYSIFLVAHSIKQVQDYMKKIDFKKVSAFIIDERDIDNDKSFHTPMLGLYSAFKELKKLKYRKVLALSCDAPLIKRDVLIYLIEQSKKFDCCIPQWNNGFLEPLIAVYPVRKALKIAKNNIKRKSFKLTNLLNSQWKTNFVPIEKSIQPLDKKLVSFVNINVQSDLELIYQDLLKTKSSNQLEEE
ncbi:MAG: molybdenum cofactor guanylyltransferase [Candidatus Hodarchaeota archaeon]